VMQLFDFPFPWTLTGVHALCGAIGSYTFYWLGIFQPTRLNERESMVVLGVVFATVGDYYFTKMGTILAALKTVVTNRVQVGRLKLHPLDLLLRMSPLAFVQTVIYAYVTGELHRVRAFSKTEMTTSLVIALATNGIIAFFLNVVSFTANKKTSALTMTVAGNVKQVLSIILAVIIFNLTITPTNGLGIFLTLLGELDLEIYNKIRPVSSVLKIHIYSRFTLNKGKFHKGALSAFHGFLQLLELFHPHESFAKILSTNPEIH
ncbi:1837_t:CDS:2, partial [Entrophospora sp. SA101]